jgi:hypothetical protein
MGRYCAELLQLPPAQNSGNAFVPVPEVIYAGKRGQAERGRIEARAERITQ